jgi:hypothetical protein
MNTIKKYSFFWLKLVLLYSYFYAIHWITARNTFAQGQAELGGSSPTMELSIPESSSKTNI